MKQEMLDILVCPHTKKKLVEADDTLLQKLNKEIKAKNIKNIANEPVDEKIAAALIEPEGNVLYIIREGIPIVLYQQAIQLK